VCVRLRGKWVNIDPRYWDADLDVQVNVALGRGTDQDKMQFLSLIAAEAGADHADGGAD